jgi:hypothetical protein
MNDRKECVSFAISRSAEGDHITITIRGPVPLADRALSKIAASFVRRVTEILPPDWIYRGSQKPSD